METLKGLKTKLTSRKFWAAVVGAVMGIATVFGLDEGVISTVAGSVMTIASILGYILTEGRIDKARIDNDILKGSTTETEFSEKGEVTRTTTKYE